MSYYPVRRTANRGWEISKDVPGPMPLKLTGMFTDEPTAWKAIKAFQHELEVKILKNMPAAQRKKVLETKGM